MRYFIWVCQNLLVPGRADLVGFEVDVAEVISVTDVDDVVVLVVVVVALFVDCCLVVSSFSPVPPPGEECVGGGRSPYNDDILLNGLRFSINLVYFINLIKEK